MFQDRSTRPQPRNPLLTRELGMIGMWLFLAALFMLFGSSLLGYAFIRLYGQRSPAHGAVHLPWLLWISTALVIGVSIAIALAQRFFMQNRQIAYRKALIAALALAAGFVTVQTPALTSVFLSHRAMLGGGMHLYGLIFFLILLHALHVIGGMVGLTWLALRVQHGGYDPANAYPIRRNALYWHFLDAIWIVMFTLFQALG